MRRIIDVHVHAYGGEDDPSSAAFGTSFTNPLTGEVLIASADPKSHLEETLAAFDDVGVVKAVVSPGTAIGVQALREADPSRVLVGHNPEHLDPERVRAARDEGMLDVLGEMTFQYQGMRPDDSRLGPIFEVAAELDVPVGYHMYPGGPPGRAAMGIERMRGAHGDPLLLEDVLERLPTLRLYVMHAAWPMLSELLALLYAYPQVCVDVGVIVWGQPRAEFYRYLRCLVEAGYTDRIMFGSDQMVWPSMIVRSVEVIEAAPFLSEGQKQAVFHDNAARFLRL